MKKLFTIVTLLSICVLLSQCVKKMTPASESTAIKAKYTPDMLAKGKVLMETNCNKCHDLHQPSEFTNKKWHEILPDMEGRTDLSKDDAKLLNAYVLSEVKS